MTGEALTANISELVAPVLDRLGYDLEDVAVLTPPGRRDIRIVLPLMAAAGLSAALVERWQGLTDPGLLGPDLVEEERRAAFEESGHHYESAYHLTLAYLPPEESHARAAKMLYENAPGDGVDWQGRLEAFVAGGRGFRRSRNGGLTQQQTSKPTNPRP